jgi:pentatricopeptide repeat protein
VQPDAWAYSAAINAFAQTGRPTQALELFRAMPHAVPPDDHF